MKDINNGAKRLGTTLIETMVVLSIMSIMCHLVLFNYQPLLINIRLDNHIAKVNRAIGLSRLSAVSYGANVTFCALKNNQCHSDNWHKELTVFTDTNKVGKFDGKDKVLFYIEPTHSEDMLTYPRPFITFRYNGTPMGFHNGTFIYCPKYKQASHKGLAISISYTGRTKIKNTSKCQE
ncbi:MAG: type IV fimbrial biogenesis protein FimT [Pseudoalteromonas rhizosphaerae]|jgi:type IV fimbrial biogenesis protein FimT|uniref:Type II secretion system protein H n=3 Tax=Pseudoalteromonas TaxID=53246 RepID=A0ABY3FEN2_9GAMM|nr:pilus assembly protein [Pseudoalteromonas neustonica]|tara:strand:- start:743 stop:1276 length:534 start_codon:yes stop_codon:yes gene_type:complete